MKTKELEIEENRKMCNNWYEEGREDMKKDVIKVIDEMNIGKWIKEELKERIEG